MPEQPPSEATPSHSATATAASPAPTDAAIPPPGEDLTIAQNWPCQPERESDEAWTLRRQLYRPWSLQPDDLVPNWPQIAMGMSATTFAAVRMQADQPPQQQPAQPPQQPGQPQQQPSPQHPEPHQPPAQPNHDREEREKQEREKREQQEREEREKREREQQQQRQRGRK